MILTCPNCATRYTLPDSQLPSGGRTVRCAACRSTWHAEKNDDPIDLPLPAEPAPSRPEDLQTVVAKKLPGQYRAMVEDKKRLKALTAQGIVWAVMGVCAVLILAIGFLLRVDIVRTFPRVAGAYAMVGLPVNASGLTLVTSDNESHAAFKGGRFVITVTAEVTNLRDKPTPVPPIRVKLFDDSQQKFGEVIIPGNGLVVEPHATRTLTFDVSDPKNMAEQFYLSYDLEGMKKSKKVNGPALRHEATPAEDGSEGEHDTATVPEAETTGPADDSPEHANPHDVGHHDVAESDPAPHDTAPALRDHHS